MGEQRRLMLPGFQGAGRGRKKTAINVKRSGAIPLALTASFMVDGGARMARRMRMVSMQAMRRRRLLRCGQCFDVDVEDAAEALPPDHQGQRAWLHMP